SVARWVPAFAGTTSWAAPAKTARRGRSSTRDLGRVAAYSAAMPSSTSRRQALAALLLCLLVLLWGVNSPGIKQVVALMPPLWAAVIGTVGAASCLIVLQWVRGRLAWPARGDLPVLASSGLAQMALSNMLVNLALQLVPAGRSAVMLYTIPLWA